MKKIIAVDGHNIATTQEQFVSAMAIIDTELANRHWHFDDGPIGNILQIADADDLLAVDYWTAQILQRSPINDKFDIVNYVSRQFAKCDNRPAPAMVPAHKRLANTRRFAGFFA